MLKIDPDLCTLCEVCVSVCPFGALERVEDRIVVLDSCRLCGVCVRKCPVGAMSIETSGSVEPKSEARNVLVVAEYHSGRLHPITLELVGKGGEMADKLSSQ